MPDNRYYLDAPLSKGATLALEGDEWHHLTRVMRGKVGSQLEIVNGRGQLAQATLVDLGKKSADLRIDEVHEEPLPSRTIILAQAMPLPSHLELIIEKGTELGASAFWLFPGERSGKKTLSENQHRRLHQITLSALKQCGRLYLPSILEMPPLAKWSVPDGELFFGDPRSDTPLRPSPSLKPIVFFIGPESGFSSSEMEILDHKFHAKGVRLHPNILRTETAALCALSILSSSL